MQIFEQKSNKNHTFFLFTYLSLAPARLKSALVVGGNGPCCEGMATRFARQNTLLRLILKKLGALGIARACPCCEPTPPPPYAKTRNFPHNPCGI